MHLSSHIILQSYMKILRNLFITQSLGLLINQLLDFESHIDKIRTAVHFRIWNLLKALEQRVISFMLISTKVHQPYFECRAIIFSSGSILYVELRRSVTVSPQKLLIKSKGYDCRSVPNFVRTINSIVSDCLGLDVSKWGGEEVIWLRILKYCIDSSK